jgi:hypothetical protein
MLLIFDTPEYVKPLPNQDKEQLVRKIQLEKKQIQMVKDLLEIVERNVNLLMEEISPLGRGWVNDGWE